MNKRKIQIKEKNADYCSMFCSTSCCNAHNTVIDGVEFGPNYCPYDGEGTDESPARK